MARIGNVPTPDEQRLIDEFLADGDYESIEEWAKDSDYRYDERSSEWYSIDDNGPNASPVDLEECIYGAMEACGFLEERL